MTTYKAKRLPVQAGPAAWNTILGPQTPADPFSGSATADFVIIGAGYAGLSAARRIHQLQPDASVMVLDAGMVGEGAAGRNSGFMIDLPHDLASEDYSGAGDDRVVIKLNRQAIDFARSAVEEYGIDENYFVPMGKVNGAASQAAHEHNRTYAKHLASLGEGSEHLDAQAMKELTGSTHYVSGLYTPGTVILQPAGYVRGLSDGLRRDGIKVHENTPVTGFTRKERGWEVSTTKGTISTGRVILANNGHLESFGFKRGQLMHLFLFASMTPNLDADTLRKLGGQPRWGVTPSDPAGTTMRRIDTGQGGNRVVTRTCAILKPGMNPTQADVDRAARTQQRKFDQRFPQLAGMAMEYKWAGHLCLSLNSVSVMGQMDEGVFAACVQNGLGTARGTLTGIGAAELACGETSDITAHFTSEDEPKKLPPRPFQEIGANAVIRWKEWKARDD